jgi:hypothetical protein
VSWQTKAFAAQDQLLTLLQAKTELSAWTIDYGLPSIRVDQHIWVDETVEQWEQSGETSGLLSKDEAFQLTLYIYDRKTGADAREIRDEVQVAAGHIADVIGSAPFLGGVVLYATIASAAYEGAFEDAQGRVREGVLKLNVGCTAFITGA